MNNSLNAEVTYSLNVRLTLSDEDFQLPYLDEWFILFQSDGKPLIVMLGKGWTVGT